MRNEITVTLVGWAATKPREIVGDGVAWTTFRLATTPRRYDTGSGQWSDGRTEWVTVKAFRELARNIATSVHKGEPVVAVGRLRTEEWEGENGLRTSLVLDAVAVGHDLSRGGSTFVRRVHVAESGDPARRADGGASAAGEPGGVGTSRGGTTDDDPWATDDAEPVAAGEPGASDGPEVPAEDRELVRS